MGLHEVHMQQLQVLYRASGNAGRGTYGLCCSSVRGLGWRCSWASTSHGTTLPSNDDLKHHSLLAFGSQLQANPAQCSIAPGKVDDAVCWCDSCDSSDRVSRNSGCGFAHGPSASPVQVNVIQGPG